MINHARTLLLNLPSKSYSPGTLGEEYIPPYSPAPLPTYITTARRIIFGTAPDKVFLNFRAHELLTLIHQTELAEFIYALDPRVTYWPKPTTDFFTEQKKANLVKSAGLRNTRLFITGKIKPDNIVGRAYRKYAINVSVVNGDTVLTVTADSVKTKIQQSLTWLQPDGGPMLLQTEQQSGLSASIPLFDSDLSIQVSTPQLSLPVLLLEDFYSLLKEDFYEIELEPGTEPMAMRAPRLALLTDQILSKWELEVYSRPGSVIPVCMPKLEFLGEPFYLQLFGVGNVEPYATFKNIWFDHPNQAYRMAAFTLAMIYRTNEITRQA